MGPTASGENPFPGSPSGSPTGGATGAADMAQRLLAAVEAATIVAQAAAQIAQNVRQGSDEKTWWKLRPKPPTFDHASERVKSLDGRNGHGHSSNTWARLTLDSAMISKK